MSEETSRLNNAAIDLLVTIGLIESVMERYPEHVQENFREKVIEVIKIVDDETREFIGFGEAYDDAVEEG